MQLVTAKACYGCAWYAIRNDMRFVGVCTRSSGGKTTEYVQRFACKNYAKRHERIKPLRYVRAKDDSKPPDGRKAKGRAK